MLFTLFALTLASPFELRSPDIRAGQPMAKQQEFQGFGCSGGNTSPALVWSGAPAGTKAFAITVYDPDAPTGSGWWHWQLINIPASVTRLPTDAGNVKAAKLPKGAMQMRNDYGQHAFGGACPPEGHGVHRYQFTVHALSKAIEVDRSSSAALVGYMLNANSLGTATLEATYRR
ncbi:MAG: YbhB/YbcL family Raf kinase inhibitor-like protein [Myxococcota bacterium]